MPKNLYDWIALRRLLLWPAKNLREQKQEKCTRCSSGMPLNEAWIYLESKQMADNRRPSSVPSEDYYKTRMANSNNTSRKSSMQAGGQSPQFICSDRSLFIFSKDNLIRKICRTIVESKVSFSALKENVFRVLALSEFVVVYSSDRVCVGFYTSPIWLWTLRFSFEIYLQHSFYSFVFRPIWKFVLTSFIP